MNTIETGAPSVTAQVSEQATAQATPATEAAQPTAKRTRKAKVVAAVATAQPSVSAETPKVDVPMIGTSAANVPDAMREAARSVAKLNAENARLQRIAKEQQGELSRLRALSGQTEAAFPISDGELRKACDFLIGATRANPSRPQRSLKSCLVLVDGKCSFVEPSKQEESAVQVIPQLGDNDANGKGQKATWKAARGEIEAMHTTWTRTEAPKLIRTVKRVLNKGTRNPGSIQAAGGYFSRGKGKDIKTVGARIAVKEKAVKAPGTGKGAAKPTVQP